MSQQQPDLSKRPPGATHWHPRVDGYEAHWAKLEGDKSYFCVTGFEAGGWVRDVKSPSPRMLVELPPIVEGWNGEGRPPVGTVCEWRDDESGPWVRVELRYLSEFTALLLFENGPGDCEGAYSPADCQFRPIRTPEQIAADERQKEVVAIGDILIANRGNSTEYHQAGLIYDAGYRKQVKS